MQWASISAVSDNTSVVSKVSYKILINLSGGREKSRSRREFWSGCNGTVVALKNYSTSHVLATVKIPLNPTIDCKVCAVVCFFTAKHKSATKIHHKLNCVLGKDVLTRPMAYLCTYHLLKGEVQHYPPLPGSEYCWRCLKSHWHLSISALHFMK